jgi:hypothetical protein
MLNFTKNDKIRVRVWNLTIHGAYNSSYGDDYDERVEGTRQHYADLWIETFFDYNDSIILPHGLSGNKFILYAEDWDFQNSIGTGHLAGLSKYNRVKPFVNTDSVFFNFRCWDRDEQDNSVEDFYRKEFIVAARQGIPLSNTTSIENVDSSFFTVFGEGSHELYNAYHFYYPGTIKSDLIQDTAENGDVYRVRYEFDYDIEYYKLLERVF